MSHARIAMLNVDHAMVLLPLIVFHVMTTSLLSLAAIALLLISITLYLTLVRHAASSVLLALVPLRMNALTA